MADHDTDSGSDSDGEGGGVGNVNRVVLRPPGHTGKAKKGHLIFDAGFEGGNLGRVDYINDYEYDLFVRPDTCNPRFRVWFNFTVENVRQDQRVIFNIVNFSKIKSLFRDGMTPIVKSTSRPRWHRIPAKFVFYYRSPEHKNHYVLSFPFAFDKEEDVYHFAYSFPFSHSRLQAYLEEMEKKKYPHFMREVIGQTLQNRPLDLITITNPKNLDSDQQQRVAFLTSRIHPGETPSSFVIQGFIDFLVSHHPIAQALRDHVIIKIVPMLNPDGVVLGNYRTSLMGFDLNRNWTESSEWAHPTLHAVKNVLLDLDLNPEVILDFCIDIHAHSSLLGSFVYGNFYDDVYRFERHTLLPKLLRQVADDFCPTNTIYNRDPLKAGTARRFFASFLNDKVNCYTLEVSFYGYHPDNGNVSSIVPYTEERFMRLGRNLARSMYEYYKAINHIPSIYPSSVTTPSRDLTRGKVKSHKGGRSKK